MDSGGIPNSSDCIVLTLLFVATLFWHKPPRCRNNTFQWLQEQEQGVLQGLPLLL